MQPRPTFVEVALVPARVVIDALLALPRLAAGLEDLAGVRDALERIAGFEVQLERIATFGDTLGDLAGLSESLAGLADATKNLGSLADAVARLEAGAAELTRAVQPLQGVAQRLNRFGRRGDASVGSD